MEENFAYALDNSGTIYMDMTEGMLRERTGVFKSMTDDGDIITTYEDMFGITEWPEDEKYFDVLETFPIAGKKGDKWKSLYPISRLIKSIIFSGKTGDFHGLFDDVDCYFNVDKSKAEDVIWLEFDPSVFGTDIARCDVNSKFFTFGDSIFFNYKNKDNDFSGTCEGERYYPYTMKTIAEYFGHCQDWLEKPLKVRVSFAYNCNPYSTEEEINKNGECIKRIEERYAQPIEDYINGFLDEKWHELDDWYDVFVPFEHKMKERWHSDRIPQEWWKKW